MFKGVVSRYVLRACVAAVLAGLSSVSVGLADGSLETVEYVSVAIAVFGVFGAYLGVGAAVPAVEPFVGNKYAGAEVPSPPAVKES